MSEQAGRRVGEGRTAEVYEYGSATVVKLLRPDFPRELVDIEAEVTAAAAEAGAPTPSVHGTTIVHGRHGIVLGLVGGISLLDLILNDLDRWDHWARLLAGVHSTILSCMAPRLIDVRQKLRERISNVGDFSESVRSRMVAALESLPDGDTLLHGDFHPSNVFVAEDDDTTVTDWSEGARGPAAADVARTLHLISPLAIPPDLPQRDRVVETAGEFTRVYLDTIVASGVTDRDQVDRWMVPVLAARLTEGIDWERSPILRQIETLV